MIIIHRGTPHTYVSTHMRGDVQVVGHWRPIPSAVIDDAETQGYAPPTNPEPAS